MTAVDTEKLSHWIQIISGVALIVGIVLVIMQMEQNKQLTRAQLAGESAALSLSRTLAFLGERPMEAMARACDPDARLTREDALVLGNVFRAYISNVGRAWEVGQRAEFGDDRWKQVANANFPLIFATQHGRDWWAARPFRSSEGLAELRDHGDRLLAELGPPTCSADVEVILNADEKKKARASALE